MDAPRWVQYISLHRHPLRNGHGFYDQRWASDVCLVSPGTPGTRLRGFWDCRTTCGFLAPPSRSRVLSVSRQFLHRGGYAAGLACWSL